MQPFRPFVPPWKYDLSVGTPVYTDPIEYIGQLLLLKYSQALTIMNFHQISLC